MRFDEEKMAGGRLQVAGFQKGQKGLNRLIRGGIPGRMTRRLID